MIDFESVIHIPTPLVEIKEELFDIKDVNVWVKRDDLTHPFISGNKFRKLKYNLLQAEQLAKRRLLTFGGAYSNHLSAFAYACKAFGFKGKAIVRGDELNPNSSATLQFADSQGIEMEFVSRTAYRDKAALAKPYQSDYYIIPEGGSNSLAIKGVEELAKEIKVEFDYLITACGTGGTMAGLLKGTDTSKEIIGVSALKGGAFLKDDISEFLEKPFLPNGTLLSNYHFGGYAKYNDELLSFIKDFENKHHILLEQVYTGKAFYAFYDLLKKDYFKRGSKIVLLHTGGLQGRALSF